MARWRIAAAVWGICFLGAVSFVYPQEAPQEEPAPPRILVKTFRGEVVAVDKLASSITVEGEGRQELFDVPRGAKIFRDADVVGLAALQKGDTVRIRYFVDAYGVNAVLSCTVE